MRICKLVEPAVLPALVGRRLSTLWFRRFQYKTRWRHLVFFITVHSWSLCDVKNRIIQQSLWEGVELQISYQGLSLEIESWSLQSDKIWSLGVVHGRSVDTADLGDESVDWYRRLKEARRLRQDHGAADLKQKASNLHICQIQIQFMNGTGFCRLFLGKTLTILSYFQIWIECYLSSDLLLCCDIIGWHAGNLWLIREFHYSDGKCKCMHFRWKHSVSWGWIKFQPTIGLWKTPTIGRW